MHDIETRVRLDGAKDCARAKIILAGRWIEFLSDWVHSAAREMVEEKQFSVRGSFLCQVGKTIRH